MENKKECKHNAVVKFEGEKCIKCDKKLTYGESYPYLWNDGKVAPQKDWKERLQEYIDSKEHRYDCIGYSEGQECCLEKEWLRVFISNLLISQKKEIVGIISKRMVDSTTEKEVDFGEDILRKLTLLKT